MAATGAALSPAPGRPPDWYSQKAPMSTTRPPSRMTSAAIGMRFAPAAAGGGATGLGGAGAVD